MAQQLSMEKQSIIPLLQPFSQKYRTPTVAKEFQIGLYDPAEADLELFCNSWSAGFLGERLYVVENILSPSPWKDHFLLQRHSQKQPNTAHERATIRLYDG